MRPYLHLIAPLAMSSRPVDRARSGVQTDSPETIEACRRGDRAALDRVFRAHAERLERLLARLVGPRAEIEDLLQDVFAAAIVAFPRFRGEASIGTWLHRIAVNVTLNHLRRPHHARQVPLVDEPHDPADQADAAVARREEAAKLYAHLDKINPKQRIALLLFVVEELSVAEIAALMGTSQTTTRSRLFWARRTVLASLRRAGGSR
jgi:RNA polymerase sigma-70 factor (ECF subfamily)